MTERKDFKKIVRDRMAETGETYTAAHAALVPADGETAQPSAAPDIPIEGATGRVKTPLELLMRAAFEEAGRLGHLWLGPEHALLAILHGDRTDPARSALVATGMTDALIERFAPPEEPRPIVSGTTSNPAWHQVHGRAEGIAAGLGDDAPSTVCFLAAMLWDNSRWLRYEDEVPRRKVVNALRQQGVRLPSSSLPPYNRYFFTQSIEVPRADLPRVVKALSDRRADDGPRFAFNGEGEIGYISAEAGIDLPGIVNEVLGNPDS